MIAARTTRRVAARNMRTVRINAPRTRFQSTTQKVADKVTPETTAGKGFSSGLAGGLTGGAIVFLLGYGYYYTSGAKTVHDTFTAAKKQYAKAQSAVAQKTPEPNEALQWLKSTALGYAAFIPGGKQYVNSAFADLEKVQEKHGDEVNKIVQQTYEDLKKESKKGLTLETAQGTWEVLERALSDIADLARDSIGDILDNHPEVKEKIGGNWEQLKKLAESKGPEAKKELDHTYSQIKEVIAGGVGVGAIDKIRKIVQEKTEKLQKLGEEAWKKGLEEAKPLLEKNPKVKEFVESNADILKKGNTAEVFEKVKNAVTSGNTDDLQEYVKKAGEAAKNSGFGKSIEQYAKYIPGGSEILPKLQKLQQVAQSRGDEAEKILKGAYKDVADVLQKRTEEAEKLAEKAGNDAKKEAKK